MYGCQVSILGPIIGIDSYNGAAGATILDSDQENLTDVWRETLVLLTEYNQILV